jgi:phage host-nuclease inhibitor protein Gam
MNEQLAAIKARFELDAADSKLIANVNEKLIRDWCRENRKGLTRDGAVKYHDFPAGRVTWRKDPPSVSIPKKAVGMILAWLHEHKLAAFIRIKEEIDKEAILANPNTAARIPEIKIRKGGERFVVEPFNVDLSVAPGGANDHA